MLEVEPDNGTRYEQETIINFNAAEKTAEQDSDNPMQNTIICIGLLKYLLTWLMEE